MWARMLRGPGGLGSGCRAGQRGAEGRARGRGGACAPGRRGKLEIRWPEPGRGLDMGAERSLARRLRAALREEEPRAVEELLRRGADPNLVLEDGVAAMHLAAGARRLRGLRCLQTLLRQGGDPNARSAEALTPLHVAASWGCPGSLELLLSRGGDPALRDQDGLRPLDLALQQGHLDCARVLRELEVGTRARREAGEPEPEPEPGSPDGPGPLAVALDSTVLQTQLDRADGRDEVLETSPNPPASPEIANKHGSSESPVGGRDCTSDSSFVTAVEASGSEDPALDTAPGARSFPQTRTPSHAAGRPLGAGLASSEAELNAFLQALTLTLSGAASFTSLRDPRGPPRGSPTHHCPGDAQAPLDSEPAALWATEDGAPDTKGRDPVSRQHLRVPAKSDLELLQALRALGESPAPITPFTRKHYLRRLQEAQEALSSDFSRHSPELAEALRTGQIPDCQADEDALAQQFQRPDPTKRWREGVVKSSFTYLLLDPRETQDLPARAFSLTRAECLQIFVRAIFYVGKGTRARPYVHLWEAIGCRGRPGKQACPKVCRILDIWDSGRGVVSLHCFQHVVAVEAYTREACLVDALGIRTLTNKKQGHYYGVVAGWPPARRRRLGVHLLHRALLVFLAEGERELRPQDIQARG